MSRLRWALFFRVVAITLLLGATAALQFRPDASMLTRALVSIYILAGITYLFTLLSAVVLRWVDRPRVFIFGQVVYEVVLITALISITGRIFSFVYILSILSAAILLFRAGAFVAALLSSAAYGGLLLSVNQWGDKIPLLNHEFLNDVSLFSPYELIYTIVINVSAYFAVAWLSSYLSEQLRRTGLQLREKEEDLEELEARSENVIRSIASGLATLDREGLITSFNRAGREITGRSERELLGRPLDALFEGLDIEHCPGELVYNHPDGAARFLNMTPTALRGSRGQEIGTLLTFQDQTRMKEMGEQLKLADRLAAVGQLAAGLAHEIRNPLASISGSIQLMRTKEYRGDEDRLMQIILRETDRLNKLITEFLHFARPSVGPTQHINLLDTIAETIELFRQGDESGGVKISIHCPENLEVDLDANMLKQILWNLCANAVEAMGGEGALDIRAEMDAHESLRISIEDSGPGIAPEIKDKIFTPFFTTKEYGTGLGLPTVYRSVESLGGKMTLKSGHGRGTSVALELPVKTGANSPKPENSVLTAS